MKILQTFETYPALRDGILGVLEAGKERARDFVQAAVGETEFVVVSTTKPNKYDRYLADVFYLAEGGEPEGVLKAGTCLNTALLEGGFAKAFVG